MNTDLEIIADNTPKKLKTYASECSEDEAIHQSKLLELENTKSEFYNHSCLYKKIGNENNQKKRREELLEEQKKRRNKLIDAKRLLNKYEEMQMECDVTPTHQRNQKNKKYANKIMLSEWLVEVPEDIDVSWFTKVCPSGHRCMIVSYRYTTKCYSRRGEFEFEFNSVLPGGNRLEHPGKETVLDCIWVKKTKTFYVIDVLKWSGRDVTEYDAEFRFFWLDSRLNELEISTSTPNNKFSIIYLPHHTSDPVSLTSVLQTFPYFPENSPQVDGLLFYHRDASYTAGITPLVGWLKPFMIPEIFRILVAQEYLNMKPAKYINLFEHIRYSKNSKKNSPKNRSPKRNNQMEIEGV